MRTIPSNTSTAALRRIPFTLVDATDLVTPEDITVTGVKVTLSFDGGTPAASTNDIVKVNGSNGEYYIELTQTEANQTAGTMVRGYLTPTGCALTKLQAQIGQGDVFAAAVEVDAASVRAAVGLTSANLETLLTTIDNLVDDLESRLTATRAGYLDNLSAGAVAQAAALTSAAADLTTLVGRLTSARAGYLDNISAGAVALGTQVDALETDVTTLLSRLSAARAGYLDNLSAGAVAQASALSSVAGYLDTEVAAILAIANKLDTMLELDGAVYRYTVNALEQGPSGSGASAETIAGAVRTELATELARLDAAISSRLATAGYTAPPSAAANASATRTELTTELGRLDAAISSRATPAQVASELTSALAVLNDLTAGEVGDAVLDEVIEGAVTLRQAIRLIAATLLGRASGLGTTTAVFRDLGDTKARVTATVDADGNRTAVTLDAT